MLTEDIIKKAEEAWNRNQENKLFCSNGLLAQLEESKKVSKVTKDDVRRAMKLAANPFVPSFEPTFLPWWSYDMPRHFDDKINIVIKRKQIKFNFKD